VFRTESRRLGKGLAVPRSLTYIHVLDAVSIQLLHSLFGENAVTSPSIAREEQLLFKCQKWYLGFINRQIETAATSLFDPIVIRSGDDKSQYAGLIRPTTETKQRVYRLMIHTAEALRSREKRGIALADIVTLLQDTRHPEHLRTGNTAYKCLAIQMIFCIAGWLTMLYEPASNQEINKLQLEHPIAVQRLRPFRTDIIHHFSLDMVFPGQSIPITQQPFHRLLHKFGGLIPCPDTLYENRNFALDNDMKAWSQWQSDLTFDTAIMVHHVCFHTLRKIAGIRIQWVRSINLHLEFDQSKRTLKLFGYPAFCWLLSRSNDNSTDILHSR
jgi:hypothetical protein